MPRAQVLPASSLNRGSDASFIPRISSTTRCPDLVEPKHGGADGESKLSLPVCRTAYLRRGHPAWQPCHAGGFSHGWQLDNFPQLHHQARPHRRAFSCDSIKYVSHEFEVGNVHIGSGKLFLIAGPCVIESEAHVRKMADAIQRITSDLGVPYIFKASYDKANRTSVESFRGPGLVEGTAILRRVAEATGLPVLTDVHEPSHCEIAAEGADVLQIPAFLCRQTDLLLAAGKTGRAVNVKKGQFVAPWDMKHTVGKLLTTGNNRFFLTERGASFGYNNLVVDMRSLPIMRKLAPVVFDGTHSVQTPSAANGVSGGQPEFIPVLTRAAVAAGVDGIFLEVHDNPAEAKSDGANALDLKYLRPLLETLLAIHEAAQVKVVSQ